MTGIRMSGLVSPSTLAGPPAAAPPAKLLSVQDLTVRYAVGRRQVHAATDVHLEVAAGEILGIIGETGSGKSTVARSLLGLLPHNALLGRGSSVHLRRRDGSVSDLARLPHNKWRDIRGSVVGFVPQATSGALNPTLTIWQHFESTLRRHADAVGRKDNRHRAEQVLSLVGLTDTARVLAAFPHQLSGGMAQRVVLALAVVLQPELLVADEPTSGLDASVRRQVLAVLKSSATAGQLGIVLVSHDIGIVSTYCDRVLVMYGGFAVEGGRATDVLARPAHPYTRALLGALPRRGQRLVVLPGAVGDLFDLPPGCPFYSRCTGAKDERCASTRPPLRFVADEHWIVSFCGTGTEGKST